MKATASEGIIINAVIESKDINLSEEYLLHLLKSNCKISDRVKLAVLIISAQPENTEKVLTALGNQYAELSNKGKRPTIKATSWNGYNNRSTYHPTRQPKEKKNSEFSTNQKDDHHLRNIKSALPPLEDADYFSFHPLR